MLNFLRNNEIVESKEDAIALLNSSGVMDIAGDGTLIEARYSDGDSVKTIFALYHVSEDSKTATIYDSEAHIEPDAKINEKITNIIDRLDKVDGGSSGSGTPGEPSLIDKVTNLIESVGDKNNLVTTDKTNLVNAINETFKKVGTIPVLVEAQLRRDGDYNVDQTTGKITNNTSFTSSENDKEGLVITFLSKDSNDKPQVKSVFIDFEKIFIESEVGNGLKVDGNHKINVNIDQNSEKYLSVSSNGLKFTGLDAEIQNRKDADTALGGRIDDEAETRQNADNALGKRIDDEAEARQNADNALDGKIATQINTLKETIEKEIKTSLGSVLVDAKLTSNKYTISPTNGKISTTSTPLPGGEVIVLSQKMPQSDGSVKYEPMVIDVEQLLLENEAGDGIKVDNHIFSVKVDPKSEERFFSVGKDGLKFSGLLEIEEVTASSLNDLNSRIKSFESGPDSVTTQINTLKETVEKEIKTATENIDLTNYVTNETLTKNYQTATVADGKYQPKGDYVTNAALKDYQTTSVADGKYATKKELSGSYYNKTYIDTELGKKADKTELTNAQKELEKKIKASQGSVLVDAKLTSNKYTISQTDGKIKTESTLLPEGGEEIVLSLKMPQSDGSIKYESIAVNVEQLLLENEAGDGIKVDNHVFGVKIDPKNEGRFFSVGKDGLKFSGLLEMEEVVAASLNDLNSRIKIFESGPDAVSRKFSELSAKIEQLEEKIKQLEAKIAKP